MITDKYKLNQNFEEFKYNSHFGEKVLSFPVYKDNKTKENLLFCHITLDEESKKIQIVSVTDRNYNIYPGYINCYGKNQIREDIDKSIIQKLKKLGAKKCKS